LKTDFGGLPKPANLIENVDTGGAAIHGADGQDKAKPKFLPNDKNPSQ
jgi:hypothetical protein